MIKQKGLCPSSQEGGFAFHIDGKPYKTLDIEEGDAWRKRRHMLSPTFSTSKLRLVCVLCVVCGGDAGVGVSVDVGGWVHVDKASMYCK